jgi:flagellar biosynthesis/type III secretory pathway chaperone
MNIPELKKETETKFNALEQQKQSLLKQLQEIAQEQLKLQGEFRAFEQMEKAEETKKK